MSADPKQIHLLRAIDWLGKREGNARYTELASIFCRIFDFSEDSLHEALDELEARKLVMKDGLNHRGVHYAITWAGGEKVRDEYGERRAA